MEIKNTDDLDINQLNQQVKKYYFFENIFNLIDYYQYIAPNSILKNKTNKNRRSFNIQNDLIQL